MNGWFQGNVQTLEPHIQARPELEWEHHIYETPRDLWRVGGIILLQRIVRRRRCGKNKIRLYRMTIRGGLEGVDVMLSARAWMVRWTWPTGGVGGCFVVRAEVGHVNRFVATRE